MASVTTTVCVMHGPPTGSDGPAEEDEMGLANITGHGYADGYPQGYSDGSGGGGSPTIRPIRMVVGHHHIGNSISGGGCYTATAQCGARINWTSSGVDTDAAHPNQYRYWANGTCANGHSISVSKWSPTGVDPGEIKYTYCRNTVYTFPTGHPDEGAFVRNVDINPGETPAGKLQLAANEKVTAVQKI